MQVFSSSVHIEADQPLGGFITQRLSVAPSDQLEINGLSFNDVGSGMCIELCAVDALYAGELVEGASGPSCRRIFAASHTHFAPMLDASKSQLGSISHQALSEWRGALRMAKRQLISPSQCTIWRADVPLPVYRRFDAPGTKLIDRSLYIFELGDGDRTDAVIILHACHPVSRSSHMHTSADYVDVLRQSVRARFGNVPCLFLLGCCGDVRPDLARKRVAWLPRSRLNWRFERSVRPESERRVDATYARAVAEAVTWKTIKLTNASLRFELKEIDLINQPPVRVPSIYLGDELRFEFVPFEVSHLFHLEAQQKEPMRFIVSCADRTLGYLPHPRQIPFSGYEVDGSRECMGLADRVLLKNGRLW